MHDPVIVDANNNSYCYLMLTTLKYLCLPLYRQIIQSEFSLTRSTTSSKWKLFRFDKMEVNCFQILLIDVTFYLHMFEKVVINVLIKNENTNICGTGG